MPKLTLYTKADCSLCDEALAAIERAGAHLEFELEQVDITSSPQLQERYGTRIPVIALNGAELFDYRVDESLLRELLSAESSTGVPAPASRTS